jgi:tRNA (guanine37-N1)-methyltransferase
MVFNFVTLFDNLIKFYFQESILKIACENNIISVNILNPRQYTTNKHQKVDNYIAGGGCGMLMSMQPMDDCLEDIKSKNPNTHIIFLSPTGKVFNQKDAKHLSEKENITFVSSRYEGVDERVIEKFADGIYSVGDYILTGGELPSLIMADAISRHIPKVLGNDESIIEESFENNLLEHPSFSKPSSYKNMNIPKVLLSGNHKNIDKLRKDMALCKTQYARSDLYLKNKINL